MGAANKVSENKIKGIKALKKIYPKKKTLWKWGQVWDGFIKRNFLLYICILIIVRGVFNISNFSSMIVNIRCSHAFSSIRRLAFENLYKENYFGGSAHETHKLYNVQYADCRPISCKIFWFLSFWLNYLSYKTFK